MGGYLSTLWIWGKSAAATAATAAATATATAATAAAAVVGVVGGESVVGVGVGAAAAAVVAADVEYECVLSQLLSEEEKEKWRRCERAVDGLVSERSECVRELMSVWKCLGSLGECVSVRGEEDTAVGVCVFVCLFVCLFVCC